MRTILILSLQVLVQNYLHRVFLSNKDQDHTWGEDTFKIKNPSQDEQFSQCGNDFMIGGKYICDDNCSISLAVNNIPKAKKLTLRFVVYILGNWEEDVFKVQANKKQVFQTKFSNQPGEDICILNENLRKLNKNKSFVNIKQRVKINLDYSKDLLINFTKTSDFPFGISDLSITYCDEDEYCKDNCEEEFEYYNGRCQLKAEFFNSKQFNKIMKRECAVLFEKCDFKGQHLEICNSNDSANGQDLPKNWQNTRSVYIPKGDNLSLSLFEERNTKGEFLELNDSIQCIELPKEPRIKQYSFVQLYNQKKFNKVLLKRNM